MLRILLCPVPTSNSRQPYRHPLQQHKEGTCGKRLLYFEGYEDIRTAIAREKQLKGWRRAKKLNLIRTINPEFKDLAQTWGWELITVHEKMYRDHQVRIAPPVVWLRWSKSSEQHG